MADEAVTLRDINWRETFPFTHLFRAFRVAVHPSKLIIALVALGCLWCGGLILDAIWPHKYEVTPVEAVGLGLSQSAMPQENLVARQLLSGRFKPVVQQERQLGAANAGIFHTFFFYEVDQANQVLMMPFHQPASLDTVDGARTRAGAFEAVWNFVAVGPLWLWTDHYVFAIIYTAWFLLIWSVFGGAISRIAAVHVARDEKISVRHALSFGAGKVLSFICAPIIPVLIIFGIGVVISLASLILLHIPWVGPIITGLFFFLALLGGFVITLVILGTIGGFNLMYPTIAVEGSDSFDAISRSFSYVFARPWRMLWYTLVAVVYGAICYLFVRFFIWLLLRVTWFFMAWFLGGQPATYWPYMWPQPTDPLTSLPYVPDYSMLKGTEATAAGLIVWWVYLVIGLVGAFAISFYFSANTIIYCLMRREVDATEMDDVYVEETEDELDQPAAAATTTAPGGTTTIVTGTTTVRIEETPAPAPGATEPPAASGDSSASTPPAT